MIKVLCIKERSFIFWLLDITGVMIMLGVGSSWSNVCRTDHSLQDLREKIFPCEGKYAHAPGNVPSVTSLTKRKNNFLSSLKANARRAKVVARKIFTPQESYFSYGPIIMDQALDNKMIVEDWKVGWRVKDVKVNALVKKDEIARLVQKFMDLDSDIARETRERARKLQQICQHAIANGGSAVTNLNTFVKDTMQSRLP